MKSLDEGAIQDRVNDIKNFDVRPANAALPAKALSGGNQQKLIIGRLRASETVVMQPTRDRVVSISSSQVGRAAR